MKNNSNENKTCMDTEHDPSILLIENAIGRIRDSIDSITNVEQVDIRRALDRVLAKDVISHINVPPYDNSAMDGYAIIGADIVREGDVKLQRITTVMAGAPFNGLVRNGQCARIMTGAKIPQGTDTVIMQEHVEVNGDLITVNGHHKPGENVRRAGEDIAIGDTVLHKGRRITPADIGLLASLGVSEISVYRKIRVAFFSTGDELKPIGSILQDGQIYDSNRYTLYGMLKRFNADIVDMGAIADDREATETAFRDAAQNADVLITTGGVSVGDADYVKETLEKLGVVNFWKLAMKPGKPLAFGRLGKCWFFGLPGNPVSAMVTFYQLVLPGLQKLSGQTELQHSTIKLPCVSPIKKRPGRLEFQRGILETNNEGKRVVRTTGDQGSHVLSSMSKANCFIILPLDCGNLEAGTEVEVQPYFGLV